MEDDEYYQYVGESFKEHMERLESFHNGRELKNFNSKIILDCANGVGAKTMREILKRVDFTKYLQFELINEAELEFLNAQCGAEYVQKDQLVPRSWNHPDQKCVAFDGDADRQVYYYQDAQGAFRCLDGDKQFALIMKYVSGLLAELNLKDSVSSVLV